MRIEFKNVGRDKRSWTETIEQQPTGPIIEKLVRKSGSLMSRNIFIDIDEGKIYAGFRTVGHFELIA